MTSQVKVKKTSSKTADITNPILIDETSTTRRLLIARIVDNEKYPDAFEWLMNKALIFKKIAKQFDK